MTKVWLIGVAAFAMMTGAVPAALAQSSSSSTTTSSTTTPAPTPGSYNWSKSQTIDSNGVQTDKSQSYTTGNDGTKASSTTQTMAPDGSQLTSHHEETTTTPLGGTTTDRSTTTTTTTKQ